MRLGNGALEIDSWVGTVCTLLLFLFIFAYALQKLEVLVNKRDTDLLSVIVKNNLSYSDVFDSSMGLNIAAAFTAYDGEQDPIDDPTVGEVVFNHFAWGENDDG